MKKFIKVIGISLGVIALAAVVFFGGLIYWMETGAIEFEPVAFNSEAWKASEPEMSWDSLRLKMADDLIRKHITIGMSRDSLIKLIGEPEQTEYFKSYDMVYYLGRERSVMGIDSEWLVIKLKDGNIHDFRLASD